MQAMRFHSYGGPEVLQVDSVADPIPERGSVVVRVRACGVNHVDLDMRSGVSRFQLDLPHTLGMEFAGDVVALGDGVTVVSVGQRVAPMFQLHCGRCSYCERGLQQHCSSRRTLGNHLPGGYAEYALVPADSLIPLPDGLGYEDAAAVQVTFSTALHALTTRARLRPGETVLVNAAGSGVGSAGIQVAKLLGARVIASAGSDDKLTRALDLGADATVNYASENLRERVMEMTQGSGVDAVLDHIGGDVFLQSVSSLAPMGRIVIVGAHAGEVVPTDLIEVFRGEWSIIGSARATASEIRQIFRMIAEKRLRPVIHGTYPLTEARSAHFEVASRKVFGKVLLLPQSP